LRDALAARLGRPAGVHSIGVFPPTPLPRPSRGGGASWGFTLERTPATSDRVGLSVVYESGIL
jgi:hypothetical protein